MKSQKYSHKITTF